MKNRKNKIKMILILLVLGLGIGYSYLNTNLNINGISNINNVNWDIHWENVQVNNGSVVADTPTIDANKTTVSFNVTLNKPGDYYEFTVDAVNAGTLDAMIDEINSKLNGSIITTLPTYLEYDVTYADNTPLELNQELLHGTSETYKVRIGYKYDISTSDLPSTAQSLSFEFSVKYKQADDDAIAVDHPQAPDNFGTDSWSTIINAVENNDTDNYNIGDTKTVDLGSLGTHTLRIANKSTPEECSSEGFSQTACGFVLEFADIVSLEMFKDSSSNSGGWRDSYARTYVNDVIYNALPQKLQSGIITTSVVSGHGSTSGENNYVTEDKLYLLSVKEIYGSERDASYDFIGEDSVYNLNRQLDYYLENNISLKNYSGASKKHLNENQIWYTRSPRRYSSGSVITILENGSWNGTGVNNENGISPAFRIG